MLWHYCAFDFRVSVKNVPHKRLAVFHVYVPFSCPSSSPTIVDAFLSFIIKLPIWFSPKGERYRGHHNELREIFSVVRIVLRSWHWSIQRKRLVSFAFNIKAFKIVSYYYWLKILRRSLRPISTSYLRSNVPAPTILSRPSSGWLWRIWRGPSSSCSILFTYC